jgi:hypothetical protein
LKKQKSSTLLLPNGTVNSVSADNATAGNISSNSILAGLNVEEQNQAPTNAAAGTTDAGSNQIKQTADLSKQFFSISRVTIINRNLKPQEITSRQSGISEKADEKTKKQAAEGSFKRGSLQTDVDKNISQDRNINIETGGNVSTKSNQSTSGSSRHGDVCAVCGNAVDETAICKVCGNNTITNDKQTVQQRNNNKGSGNKSNNSKSSGSSKNTNKSKSGSSRKTSTDEDINGQNQAAKDNTTTTVPEGANSNNKQNIQINKKGTADKQSDANTNINQDSADTYNDKNKEKEGEINPQSNNSTSTKQ